MNQETVINRVLRDMKMMGWTDEYSNGFIRPFLNYAYVAGWEQGKKSLGGHKKRKVELYDTRKNIKIPFDSIVVASHTIKDSVRTISRSLHSGIATEKGHIWSYK
jgi:hypothetical protein